MKYYAINKGNKVGVFTSWATVRDAVTGFPGACYKAFASPIDAAYFVEHGEDPPSRAKKASSAPATVPSFKKPGIKLPSASPSAGANVPVLATPNSDSGVRHNLTTLKSQYQAFEPTSQVYIYTDGSTFNNGKKNAVGGYGVFFSDTNIPEVSAPVDGPKVTNNVAELLALEYALKAARQYKLKATIYTDSQYAINCLTKWCQKWQQNGWVSSGYRGGPPKPIKNRELIEKCYNDLIKSNCTLQHINSHTGKMDRHSIGNEIADRLAQLAGRT